MLIVDRLQINPYFNIAAEEYLLKTLHDDCFMLWQNEPSVIVGKHQNTLAEINYTLVRQLNIPVIRRISGGGTVYHDAGNLNFTFIKKGLVGKMVDFSQFIQPIIQILKRIGIDARHDGKNDIRVGGRKISGNAEHIHRDRVLHHGTLLFNSDLQVLNDLISIKQKSFKDKSVQSVRSQVANISEFLLNPISISEFRKIILEGISSSIKDIHFYTMTREDINGINDLAEKKYKTWEWNFGYSPDYIFENKIVHRGEEFLIKIKVKNGVIMDSKISSGSSVNVVNKDLKNLLIGTNHSFEEINQKVYKLNRKGESLNFDPNILFELLF